MASPLNDMTVKITLIGCGGTGGCLFSRMVRFLWDGVFDADIEFFLMDGDHVEEKNLGRQPFLEEDIGKNKAVALASIADEILGVKVKAYPFYLTSENKDILEQRMSPQREEDLQILIGAVDNHACRILLHKYFMNYRLPGTLFYIDSANEFSCGEIVVGKRNRKKIFMPDRVHYYPGILEDPGRPVEELGCEELNASAPQHLAVNSLAADFVFSYVAQLLMAGKNAKMAQGGIIYFDAFKLFGRFDVYEEERHGRINQ